MHMGTTSGELLAHLTFKLERTLYSYDSPVLLRRGRKKSSTQTPYPMNVTCQVTVMDHQEVLGRTGLSFLPFMIIYLIFK